MPDPAPVSVTLNNYSIYVLIIHSSTSDVKAILHELRHIALNIV